VGERQDSRFLALSALGGFGLCCYVGFGIEGLSGVWICRCSYCIVWVSSTRLEPLVYNAYVLRGASMLFHKKKIHYLSKQKIILMS
jgi:hypothetical protein